MEMLGDKIKFVTDKLTGLMPEKDAASFRNLMYSYVKLVQNGVRNLPAPNTNNQRINSLATAILNSLAKENMNPATGSAKKSYGRTSYRYYWNYPWWWNYWYYNWSPYYWWTWDPNPYDGIGYVGGSKKVGHSCNGTNGTGALDNVLDAAVDIQSMNLNCDDNRVCDFSVRFVKAPLTNPALVTSFNGNSNANALNGNGLVFNGNAIDNAFDDFEEEDDLVDVVTINGNGFELEQVSL